MNCVRQNEKGEGQQMRIHSGDIDWIMTGEEMWHGDGPLCDPSRRRYSVDKAKRFLLTRTRMSEPYEIPEYWSDYDFSGADRVRRYDTSKAIPIIAGMIDGEAVVIDGCNRISEAGMEEKRELQAFYLTEQETITIELK